MALICAECNSAETSTGLGDTITCFQCGFHGDHKHVGQPSPSGEPAEVEDAADVSEDNA